MQKIRFSFINRFSRLLFLNIGFIFALTSLWFIIGFKLSFYTSITIFILSLIGSNFILGLKKDSILLTISLFIFLSILFIFSQFYIDLTFDGQAYHQEMVIQLSKGWNPIYESIDKSNNQSIWVNHYPKGYELICALFYSLINKITGVKFINLAVLFLSFLYPLIYFKKKETNKVNAYLIAFIITFNPVSLTQIMTNLIDGFLYCISIIVVFSYLLSKLNKNYLFDFVLSFILIINIKFTGLIFGSFIVLIIMLYEIFRFKKIKVHVLKKGIILILITLPFLISPYFKNTLEKGNPFYPLMGKNKIDFVEDYVPGILKDKNKINRIIVSNFASIGNREDSKIKIPFTFTFNELQKLRNGGPRVGSFGVFWGGILLLSLIFYAISIYKQRKIFKLSIFELIIATIVLLLIVNKAGWWLRYTPYFWLTPLLLVLSIKRYKSIKNQLKVLSILVMINGLLTLVVSLGLRFKDSRKFITKLNELEKIEKPILVDFKAYLGNKALFDEYNIAYIESDSKTFKTPKVFNNVVIIENENNE